MLFLVAASGCSSDGQVGEENTGGSGNANGVGGSSGSTNGGSSGSTNGGSSGSTNGGSSGSTNGGSSNGGSSGSGGQCMPATQNAGVCETCLADSCCAGYDACEGDQYCASQLDKFRTCRASGGGHECCYELAMPNNPSLNTLFDCCYGQQVVCYQACEPGS
jgi:hypothetical protein